MIVERIEKVMEAGRLTFHDMQRIVRYFEERRLADQYGEMVVIVFWSDKIHRLLDRALMSSGARLNSISERRRLIDGPKFCKCSESAPASAKVVNRCCICEGFINQDLKK